jgi:hypothetical protein
MTADKGNPERTREVKPTPEGDTDFRGGEPLSVKWPAPDKGNAPVSQFLITSADAAAGGDSSEASGESTT